VKLKVHVERLVLDGVDLAPGGKEPFRLAMRTELERLLISRGLPPSLQGGAALETLKGDPISTADGARPQSLGTSIALAIHGGLTR
jgi:hypothetical protein